MSGYIGTSPLHIVLTLYREDIISSTPTELQWEDPIGHCTRIWDEIEMDAITLSQIKRYGDAVVFINPEGGAGDVGGDVGKISSIVIVILTIVMLLLKR